MSENEESVKPSDVVDELRNCEDEIPIFERLIRYARLIRSHSATSENTKEKWEPILTHIVEIISDNGEPEFKRVMLACYAFYALLLTQPETWRPSDIVMQFLKLESRNLHFLEQRYVVSDLEMFKLLNACVYMHINRQNDMYNDSVLLTMFDIIRRNCTKYIRYSYFAHKVLEVWLKRTRNCDMRFWERRDKFMEQKLEAVIFSNWSNAFRTVHKLNAQFFGVYLQIMSDKYEGFLGYIFDTCDKHISWRNETRFAILAEVLLQWGNVKTMMTKLTPDFLYKLFSALTRESLHSAATRVYLIILEKLSKTRWIEVFGETMETVIELWCSKESKDYNALYSLCVLWLNPTLDKHSSLIEFFWCLQGEARGSRCLPSYLFRDSYLASYLLLTADRLHVPLPGTRDADYYINDSEEATRGNIFIALCYRAVDYPYFDNYKDFMTERYAHPFFRMKHFLWFNANASVAMREVIVQFVRMLYSEILKTISLQGFCMKSDLLSDFTEWLHEFLLDCLEIGSCYRRKILALKLYKVLLEFTNKDSYRSCEPRLCLRATNTSTFTNKESLFVLLRLVLDRTRDVRQLAADLILKYFERDVLSTADKDVIYRCGLLHCNSRRYYEIESGATLMKILAHWTPPGEIREDSSETYPPSCTNLLLDTARQQLALIKSDILKAVAQNCPFYGTLTALLAVAFRSPGPECRNLTPQFTTEVLSLTEDAVDFFLSRLFMKQSNTAYSSSSARMDSAVDEHIKASETDDCNYDKLQLPPAHQVLISCNWLSLKVLCDVASEIGMLTHSDAMVKSSMDIIVTVLLVCQHKDVVESAGMAVANLSRHLYDKKEYCELPRTYLMNLLEEDTGGELMHLTRRGAGLSVMFHRLVVSDKRKSRPTVHFAVRKLLRSLANFSLAEMRRVKSEEDSPWAIRLHFLRALVADKEIHASLVPYMEEICLRCFDYIESDVRTVRNASLQLYGAVVSRLTGQCSGGKNDDSSSGHSFNHFVTHYPMLADRMLTQLRATSKITGTSGAALRSYAKLAHTLALLSRLWTGGCDLVDYPSTALIEKFRNLLYELCEKPMIHVRQLAAKAYAALTPVTQLGATLRTIHETIGKSKDDNCSYGLFLIVRHLTERLKQSDLALTCHVPTDASYVSDNPQDNGHAISGLFLSKEKFHERYEDILSAWRDVCEGKGHRKQPCYMLETQFCEQQDLDSDSRFLPHDDLSHDEEWTTIERVTPSQKIQPGFFQFLLFRALFLARGLEDRVKNETFDKSVPTIARVLNSDCTELSIGFLTGLSQSVPLFELILTHLISMRDDHDPLLLDHMVTLARIMMKNVDLFEGNETNLDDLTRRFCEIEASTVATSPSVIGMKYALILAFSEHEALVNDALSHVLGLCADDEGSTRLAATDYIDLASRRFARLTNEGKFALMKCCLILLKDEIAEIRDVVSTLLQKRRIYPELKCGFGPLKHEEMVYQRFLDIFMRQLLDGELSTVHETPDEQLANVISYFTREIGDSAGSKATVENPFYHEDAAFYREESKFLSLCYVYMELREYDESLFESLFTDVSNFDTCYDVTRAIEISRELRQKIAPNWDDLQTVLYTKEMDYLTRKRDFVLQCLSTQTVRPSFS